MSNDNWLRPQLLLALKLDRAAIFGSSIIRRMHNSPPRDPVSPVQAEDRYVCLAGRSHRQNHPWRSSAAALRISDLVFEGDEVTGQGGADLNSALRPSEPFAVPWGAIMIECRSAYSAIHLSSAMPPKSTESTPFGERSWRPRWWWRYQSLSCFSSSRTFFVDGLTSGATKGWIGLPVSV